MAPEECKAGTLVTDAHGKIGLIVDSVKKSGHNKGLVEVHWQGAYLSA